LSIPWGGYGIHGTNNPKSIGKAVSHGCVRMYNTDVIEVYERTPVGTPVTIIGKAYNRRTLKIGDQGSDVQEIQKMLKKLRFYRAKLDGEYGPYTEQAVRNFQQEQSLMVDGMVGSATLTAIQRAYAQTF
jgi:L,D-transpeptidase ErfK/SrfK